MREQQFGSKKTLIAEMVGYAATEGCHDDTTEVGKNRLDCKVGTLAAWAHTIHC